MVTGRESRKGSVANESEAEREKNQENKHKKLRNALLENTNYRTYTTFTKFQALV